MSRSIRLFRSLPHHFTSSNRMLLHTLLFATRGTTYTHCYGLCNMTLNIAVYAMGESHNWVSWATHCCGADYYIEYIHKCAASHTHSDTAYKVVNDLLTVISAPNNKVKRDIGDYEHSQGKALHRPPQASLTCQSYALPCITQICMSIPHHLDKYEACPTTVNGDCPPQFDFCGTQRSLIGC